MLIGNVMREDLLISQFEFANAVHGGLPSARKTEESLSLFLNI
jgi:hypothetical protein